MKKLLLVDLDDTLINTSQLKRDLFTEISKTFLLDLPEIEKLYKETLPSRHNMWTIFLEKIVQNAPSKKPELLRIVDENIKKSVLREEAVSLVKQFSGCKVLFSLGEEQFQKRKVELLDLGHLFDGIHITAKPKIEFFRKHVIDGALKAFNGSFSDVTVLDDHRTFLRELTVMYPWVKVIDSNELIK